jgi:hypothetical protein
METEKKDYANNSYSILIITKETLTDKLASCDNKTEELIKTIDWKEDTIDGREWCVFSIITTDGLETINNEDREIWDQFVASIHENEKMLVTEIW